MNTLIPLALLGVTLAVPFPLAAADGHRERGAGRYEWRQVPQIGPRATGPLDRALVEEARQVASILAATSAMCN